MVNVIVAFPKAEVGKKIKGLLTRSGFHVTHVLTSGAQVLSAAHELDYGIAVMAARPGDLPWQTVAEDLPQGFLLLVILSGTQQPECVDERVYSLSQPVRAGELIREVERLSRLAQSRKKRLKQTPKKRSMEERQIIQKAKDTLMQEHGWTEDEAHRYLQRSSMDHACSMVNMAQRILTGRE